MRDLVDVLLERTRALAFDGDPHRRAWEAVRTAAVLRREGRHELALALLDDVVDAFGHPHVHAAAYTCAVAVHCDRGEPETALTVGLPVWRACRTLELGHALVRAYWERFERSGDADDRDEWLAFKDELEALEAARP